jgi:DedD protein
MNEADDVQLQLKKKARRRLVGAIAFAAFAALALPLVMNHEPPPPAQDVEFRIPDQNDAALAPLQPEAVPVPIPVPVEPVTPELPAPQPPVQPAAPTVTVTQTTPQPTPAQAAATPKVDNKPEVKPAPKPEAKPTPKPEVKPEPKKLSAAEIEAQRAEAILAGKLPDVVAAAPTTPKPAAAAVPAPKPAAAATVPAPAAVPNAPHVVLIGAFSDEANVQNLKQKLTELRIPVYTEALDSPQGKKTRVRAGPFVSREAAEQALVKMQRIGVSGPVVPQ